jgi:hypothetical protein
MIPINKPEFQVREVFLECISSVNNKSLKKDLEDCTKLLELAEADFESKFFSLQIHTIKPSKTITSKIDKVEMVKVYTDRMVQKEIPRKKYYSSIKLSAPYGKCPLCSVRTADTLDHYLPKSKFPIFAVTPITIIPSCTPCNKGKLITYPTNSDDQTLHPYFDNIDSISWLKASVIQTNPITFNFSVAPHPSWRQSLKNRVENHFSAFQLNELFSSHASEELRGAKLQLTKLFRSHPDLLKEHLKEAYESRLALGLNSWQAAMYKSLLKDDWFCNGGVLV